MLDGIHIGNCGIKIISSVKKECEIWGYIGDPKFRKSGFGTAATKLLIEKAFSIFFMNNIVVHVAGYNEPALRMYTKLGFTRIPIRDDETEWQNRECEIIKMFL
jgi:RimJ/RimL family protein N-acetyltransferase